MIVVVIVLGLIAYFLLASGCRPVPRSLLMGWHRPASTPMSVPRT
jgi:hypothetical protein